MKTSFPKLLLGLSIGLLMSSVASAQTYCGSGATSNTDSDITNVSIGNINNNTTAGGCATYTHFNTMSTDLYVGSSYQISVTLGVHTGCGSD
ncbi:MAG: hypothetical protein LPK45_03520, partial [Bacteroidota bacterium]|nr:hypothetical protein [Bacteroidota bacterium]MDX5430120.1 hypothetical protein [Bacteroidota bacterium]MDX5468881.1 hypothetical protein [Bacteroidota bacterium]